MTLNNYQYALSILIDSSISMEEITIFKEKQPLVNIYSIGGEVVGDFVKVFQNEAQMKAFFISESSEYLPKEFFLKDEESTERVKRMMEEIHNLRIKNGYKKDNVLLSIAFPSYNRGHRLVQSVEMLRMLNYDAEIEIVISNNGSTKNLEGYQTLSESDDKRIHYFAFEENQQFYGNVAQVLRMSSGKYTLLLSDEDYVNIYELAYYLKVLFILRDVSVIRTATSKQYAQIETGLFAAGDEAITAFYLRNNYMSGVIYNREMMKDMYINYLEMKYKDNLGYQLYTHMFYDTLAVTLGNFYRDSRALILEGDAEEDMVCSDDNKSIPAYAEFESRLNQQRGFLAIIKEHPFANDSEKVRMLYCLFLKTYYLLSIMKEEYVKMGYDSKTRQEKFVSHCLADIKYFDHSFVNENIEEWTSMINELGEALAQ